MSIKRLHKRSNMAPVPPLLVPCGAWGSVLGAVTAIALTMVSVPRPGSPAAKHKVSPRTIPPSTPAFWSVLPVQRSNVCKMHTYTHTHTRTCIHTLSNPSLPSHYSKDQSKILSTTYKTSDLWPPTRHINTPRSFSPSSSPA